MEYCVGMCTDGTAVMIGKKNKLWAQITNLNNTTALIYMHCIIHSEALATKKIASELH